MKAIVAPQPDGADELALVERPVPQRRARRSADQGRRGRASTGPTSCSGAASIRRRRARPTSSGSKSPERSSRRARAPSDLVGQKVCALVAGGGYAEYCVAPAGTCLPVPEVVSLVEAAAMPETLFTVWVNLFERGFAADGDWVLVHGGTSGIGTMAIALGQSVRAQGHRHLRHATSKCARALDARRGRGDQLSRRRTSSRRFTGSPSGAGVNVVLDMVGGDYVPRNLACLAEEGRHVSIAVQRGATAEIPIVDIMRRRLTLTGSTLRPRSVEFKTHGRRRDRQDGLALCRGRPAEAGDRQHLPARRGRRRARAMEAASMSARSCWRSAP